ncbi:MAG: DUF3054 domain-containing protein [Propionicimonas sp.]
MRDLALDLVTVIGFAAIGRASHAEDLSPGGMAQTAWPFVVAVVVGSLLGQRLASSSWWRQGIVVWAVTVIGGLALRLAAGQSSAVGFVVVTTLVLGLLLIGWRALARPRNP